MSVQAAYKAQKPTLIDIPISNNGGRVIVEANLIMEPHDMRFNSACMRFNSACMHSDALRLEVDAASVVHMLDGTPALPFECTTP